jgi:hypothetical protein
MIFFLKKKMLLNFFIKQTYFCLAQLFFLLKSLFKLLNAIPNRLLVSFGTISGLVTCQLVIGFLRDLQNNKDLLGVPTGLTLMLKSVDSFREY